MARVFKARMILYAAYGHCIIREDGSCYEHPLWFELAKEKKLVIMPYQHRRFDSDYLILKEVLKGGDLGEIIELESHFDRFRPNEQMSFGKAEDGSFCGLGSHLIDQMISLFGKPEKIYYDVKSIKYKKTTKFNHEIRGFMFYKIDILFNTHFWNFAFND